MNHPGRRLPFEQRAATMLDAHNLSEWFEHHAAPLVLYARQWLDAASAEDAVHDVFLHLMAQRERPVNVKAWLYCAVRNRATSAIRSSSRRRRYENLAAQTRNQLFQPDFENQIDAANAETMLRKLPALQREIVTLRIWARMSFKEIAAIVNLPGSTVFDHYRGALSEIKQKLESSCPMNES
jgi:RNA polymerase sigma-70 factor (ECF subfamily)